MLPQIRVEPMLSQRQGRSSAAAPSLPGSTLEQIDSQLFERYVYEFPCFRSESVNLANLNEFRFRLMRTGLGDQAAKELALDCVLELLSGTDFEITWKDIFDVFSADDREAFFRIMSQHNAMMEERQVVGG